MAMKWVREITVGKSSYKAVLVALAWLHIDKDDSCDPAKKSIEEFTELNWKTIKKALVWLQDAGFITIEKRPGLTDNYRLNMDITSSKIGGGSTQGKVGNLQAGTPSKFGTTQPPPKLEGAQKLSPPPKTELTPSNIGATPPPNLEPVKEKKNKIYKYKGLCLAKIPVNQHDSFKEFIDHRKNLKKPLTQAALDRAFTGVGKASIELAWPPEQVLAKTIDAGWQGINAEWLRNRYCQSQASQPGTGAPSTRDRSLEDDLTDTSWADSA